MSRSRAWLRASKSRCYNNGADAQIVAANGAYTFTTPVAYNGSYAVTVGTQPTGQTCSVANGTSTGVTANVTNVNITCATLTFTIGGTVTGLAAGQQVTLLNNGSDAKVVVANGVYAFTTPVPFNGSYAVTVGTQPVGQNCSVSSGSGSGVVAPITNVAVNCLTAVPNVVGLTQAAANTAITGAGLIVGTLTTTPSGTVPAGSVISESPVAGTLVNPGSAVSLVVSTGRIAVPNVVGLTQAAATTAITNAGLTLGTVTTAASGTVPAGSVISESPVAGTLVNPGSAVNLVVSSGALVPTWWVRRRRRRRRRSRQRAWRSAR